MSGSMAQLEEALADRYVFKREIGRGGMATVYLAEDLKHNRKVAVKILKPELSAGVLADRFDREIEVLAGLTHPRILPLFDSGVAAGLLYYVMPYLEGESLRQRLNREGQLPLEDAAEITRQVGGALAYAHARNVIHRDIKPENIMLTPGGALVADFGIAYAVTANQSDERLTQAGMAVGTPAYMSAEQAAGADVDSRSDQYSLACVLYEMLTGDPPFSGKNRQAVMARHTLDPALPVSSARNTVPEAMEYAVMRGLAKAPSDRFKTMEAFVAAVSEMGVTPVTPVPARPTGGVPTPHFGTGHGEGSRSAVPAWRRVAPIAGGAALIGVAGLAAIVAGWLGGSPGAPALDPSHVAVLYFDDLTPAQELGYLADGLTETLIHELAGVGPLRVVTRNGVKPYRDAALETDSLARVLGVGSIVEGTIERSGDSLVARVSLMNGATGFNEVSARLAAVGDDPVQLRDEIVSEAKRLLAGFIGTTIREEAIRAGTSSGAAWSLFRQAERLRDDADRVRWGLNDTEAAGALLVEADSLLHEAETADRDWAEPIVARGWVASARARLPSTQRSRRDEGAYREALGHADRALALEPGSAAALELRGTVNYELTWLAGIAADTAVTSRLFADAEADLRAAVSADSTRALAYVGLADLKRVQGDFAEASVAAQRALEADPFLVNAEAYILLTLAQAWMDLRELELAKQWNEEGIRRYPLQPQWRAASLVMLAGWEEWADAVDTAHAFASYPALAGWGPRRLLLAAVLARAGRRDSALSLIRQVRDEEPPAAWLDYYEAEARVQLGEPDEAIRLLASYLEANPARKPYVAKEWWWESLRDDPEFAALVGTDER